MGLKSSSSTAPSERAQSMHESIRQNLPIAPIFLADKVSLAVSSGKLRLVYLQSVSL
jgi:hypothetical protein